MLTTVGTAQGAIGLTDRGQGARLRPPRGAVPPYVVGEHKGCVPPRHARQQVPARVHYGLRGARARLRPPADGALQAGVLWPLSCWSSNPSCTE